MKAWSERLESVRKDVECFFNILRDVSGFFKMPIQYRDKVNRQYNLQHLPYLLGRMVFPRKNANRRRGKGRGREGEVTLRLMRIRRLNKNRVRQA